MTPEDKKTLELFSARMRRWVIEGVYNAKSGHPGGSLILRILTVTDSSFPRDTVHRLFIPHWDFEDSSMLMR